MIVLQNPGLNITQWLHQSQDWLLSSSGSFRKVPAWFQTSEWGRCLGAPGMCSHSEVSSLQAMTWLLPREGV